MGEKMSPVGRPKKDKTKDKEIKIRATQEDRDKLLYCCRMTGMSQYKVVMAGIDKIYNELIKGTS